MAEGRVAELAAPLELVREEARHVVPGGQLERARVRLEALHQHAPGRVAAAASGELRYELEGALLGAQVGEPQSRVRVDDRGQRDAGEVVALRDHLRAEQDGAVGVAETAQGGGQLLGVARRVGVQPDQLQLRHAGGQLPLEPLRAGADPGQLDRAAGRAFGRLRLGVPAVVAAQAPVPVEHEGDVAVGAAEGRPAGPAMQRGRDPAAVEEQDRLAAVLGDRAELREQRRGERVAGLATQVDDPHRRQLPAEPLRQLEPLERSPALGPRRGASVQSDRALERRPLGRDCPRIVAGIRLLLVGGVVLLVDADQPDTIHRREDR